MPTHVPPYTPFPLAVPAASGTPAFGGFAVLKVHEGRRRAKACGEGRMASGFRPTPNSTGFTSIPASDITPLTTSKPLPYLPLNPEPKPPKKLPLSENRLSRPIPRRGKPSWLPKVGSSPILGSSPPRNMTHSTKNSSLRIMKNPLGRSKSASARRNTDNQYPCLSPADNHTQSQFPSIVRLRL